MVEFPFNFHFWIADYCPSFFITRQSAVFSLPNNVNIHYRCMGSVRKAEYLGLLPRVVESLFSTVALSAEDNSSYLIDCSYWLVHQDTLTDLLNTSVSDMKVCAISRVQTLTMTPDNKSP